MKNARPVSKGLAFFHQVQYVLLPQKQKLDTAFVGVGRITADEERFVLSKPVLHFSFTYGAKGSFV